MPEPFVLILLDNETVSAGFNFAANLDVRFKLNVSLWVNRKVVSADTVPVVVIGFGLTVIPVPPDIDVNEPLPPPEPAPPPRGKITV